MQVRHWLLSVAGGEDLEDLRVSGDLSIGGRQGKDEALLVANRQVLFPKHCSQFLLTAAQVRFQHQQLAVDVPEVGVTFFVDCSGQLTLENKGIILTF